MVIQIRNNEADEPNDSLSKFVFISSKLITFLFIQGVSKNFRDICIMEKLACQCLSSLS